MFGGCALGVGRTVRLWLEVVALDLLLVQLLRDLNAESLSGTRLFIVDAGAVLGAEGSTAI